jgi:hypothetical protein
VHKAHRHLRSDCLDNVGSSTPHNSASTASYGDSLTLNISLISFLIFCLFNYVENRRGSYTGIHSPVSERRHPEVQTGTFNLSPLPDAAEYSVVIE